MIRLRTGRAGDAPAGVEPRRLDRELVGLALPAFATLIAEPLMLMVDAAVVGHVSTPALAGIGVAGNVLTVVVGLCIFLAYGTTATVARRLGSGDRAGAVTAGLDGLGLGLIIGAVTAVSVSLAAPTIVGWYPADPEVAEQATRYLQVAALGLLPLLTMTAATGVLRGLQDTRTPLWVALGANVINAVLSVTLVHGAGLGVVGAALGTVIAQTLAAVTLVTLVLRRARRERAPWRVRPFGILSAARQGGWLLLRTLWLQIAVTTTTVTATGFGAVALASHQIANALWAFLAMALDAIAIAAQAIIGRYLGAGDAATARWLTRRMLRWGVVGGVGFGLLVWVSRPFYVGLFTPDPAVQQTLAWVLPVIALITPVSAVVFVLDGVLIGAGDARYLAGAGLVALIAYLPLVLTVRHLEAGLVWLWVAYCGYMVARMITLAVRSRSTAWTRTGA